MELTNRQLEILALVGNGKRVAEIAKDLFISERTVEHTLRDVRDKMEVGTTIQAFARAVAEEQLILSSEGAVRVPAFA